VVPQSQLPSCPPGGCIVVTAVLFELADNLTQDNGWLGPLFDAMPYTEGVSFNRLGVAWCCVLVLAVV
jgi:hypothetical protein